jgi:hypothetical protein
LQRLKQDLNDVLGSNHHRVRPRQKGDTIVYLHFITLEDVRIAKETLTAQGVANYKLTVTVCWCCGGTAGFENLSHEQRSLASKIEVVAVLVQHWMSLGTFTEILLRFPVTPPYLFPPTNRK